MSPIDRAIVARKLAQIEERLRVLRPIAGLPLADYSADLIRKKGAEKLLQEAVNAATDLNFHLVVESGRGTPPDSHASFLALVSLGILDAETAQSLAPFAGLRNRLVHEYETLDDAKVLAAIDEAERVLPRYVQAVRNHYGPGSVSTGEPGRG